MKGIDYVNVNVAKELNQPLNIVEQINKEYWREIKRKMNDLESTNIFVRKVGTFMVSKYLINKKIKKTISTIRNTKVSTKYSEIKRNEILKNLYNRLRKLLKQRNEVSKIYYEQRINRILKSDTKSS